MTVTWKFPKIDETALEKVKQMTHGTTHDYDGIDYLYCNKPMEIEMVQRPKHSCPYCHGETFDDHLGHCAACGGPREPKRVERVFSGYATSTAEVPRQFIWSIGESPLTLPFTTGVTVKPSRGY